VQRSLVLNLELENYDVHTANNGEEGISQVDKIQPNLVIMDVMMPVKDGLQTCKELREQGNSTPIILLTARNDEVDKVLGLELGA
ncbi:UNVERIFIED_CONTAM: hypothetical protein GTU68_023322, partial [Idotea baltica]|nr:hypothetical protein [Idotea baltica]